MISPKTTQPPPKGGRLLGPYVMKIVKAQASALTPAQEQPGFFARHATPLTLLPNNKRILPNNAADVKYICECFSYDFVERSCFYRSVFK
jgi:hypothetical protein